MRFRPAIAIAVLVAAGLTGCAPEGKPSPCASSVSAAAEVVHSDGTWTSSDIPLTPADIVSIHWQQRVRPEIHDYCDERAIPAQDPIEYTILLELTPTKYAELRAGWETSVDRPAVPAGLAAIAGDGTAWLGGGNRALADGRPYLLVTADRPPV